jgi:hypothetical protein
MVALEQLPLPMLALHSLKTEEPGSPWAVLEAARKLRDSHDVRSVRKWLARWESKYSSDDDHAKEETRGELAKLESALDLRKQKLDLIAIARFHHPDSAGGAPAWDLSGLSATVARLVAKMSRRPAFLAALQRELTHDEELGARLGGMIGRAISVPQSG